MSNENETLDIFQLLQTASQKKRSEERSTILDSLGVPDFFDEGSISVNTQTCRGVECKLCIEACPTHALYWQSGEIKVEENLCVYCTACVLSCIVDNCIVLARKRRNGEREEFSTPRQVFLLLQRICSKKKIERIKSILEEEMLQKIDSS